LRLGLFNPTPLLVNTVGGSAPEVLICIEEEQQYCSDNYERRFVLALNTVRIPKTAARSDAGKFAHAVELPITTLRDEARH